MYNGIGLQTARGSGTNGYVQTNKFFVRPRTGGKPDNGGKGFQDDQGTAGLSKKPNKAILEHDRKRQIHLKLAILEDKLADQGYSDAEIAQKLEEARVNLEAAAAANEETDTPGDSKISDTQTHQVAARKEKQMEAFRAALGLPDQQAEAEEGIIEDEPTGDAYEGRLKERREHSFLDRDNGRKRDEDVAEKDGKDKENKKMRGDDTEKVKRHKRKDSKKIRHGDSSDESDGRYCRRRSKKKARGRKQESDSESDSSSSDSDTDDGKKRRRIATKKRSRSRRSVSSESEEVESGDNKKLRKSHKKSKPSNRSGSKEVRGKHDEQSKTGRKRHDSDDSEPESEGNKQLRRKKEAYHGGRKQKRYDEDEESSPLEGRHRSDSGGKKAERDSDDTETEYENKKRLRSKVETYSAGMSQKRVKEDAVPNHGKDKYSSDSRSKKVASDSDDSEAEYENRRKLKDGSYEGGRKLKDGSYEGGRKQTRDEDDDYSNHGRNRYRSDDAIKRRGTIKKDDDSSKHKMDKYRGRGIEEQDDDRDNRYRPKYEMAEDDEYYKRSRYRYRADEDRSRGDAGGKRREDEDEDRVSRDKGRSHYGGRSSGKRSSYDDRD